MNKQGTWILSFSKQGSFPWKHLLLNSGRETDCGMRVLSFASSQATSNLITSEEKSVIRVINSCFHPPANMLMFQTFWLDIMEIDLKTCSFCLNKLLSFFFPLSLFRTRENFPWGTSMEPHAWSEHLIGGHIISRLRSKELPDATLLTSRCERTWRNNF